MIREGILRKKVHVGHIPVITIVLNIPPLYEEPQYSCLNSRLHMVSRTIGLQDFTLQLYCVCSTMGHFLMLPRQYK